MPSGAWCATRSARTRTARVRSPAIRTRRARERTRTSFASPLDARTAVFSPARRSRRPSPPSSLQALRLWKDGQELFVESMKEPGGRSSGASRPARGNARPARRRRRRRRSSRSTCTPTSTSRRARCSRRRRRLRFSPRATPRRRRRRRPRARRPRARRRRAERQAPPRPRRRRERAQAPAPRGRAAVLQPDVPEPRAHERLLALVAGRLGGGAVQAVLRSPGGFPITPASLSHAYALRDSLS